MPRRAAVRTASRLRTYLKLQGNMLQTFTAESSMVSRHRLLRFGSKFKPLAVPTQVQLIICRAISTGVGRSYTRAAAADRA